MNLHSDISQALGTSNLQCALPNRTIHLPGEEVTSFAALSRSSIARPIATESLDVTLGVRTVLVGNRMDCSSIRNLQDFRRDSFEGTSGLCNCGNYVIRDIATLTASD